MGMRATVIAIVCTLLSASRVGAQAAVVGGEVILREDGRPVGYATVSVLSQGRQLLTGENGKFLVTVAPGEVRLRFKRIGFAPKDTAFVVGANDTARVRVEMTRLVIQLPEMLVSGRCTNESPREPMPGFLAQLIDQVVQNAERMVLLGQSKPFELRIEVLDGLLGRDGRFTVTRSDTIVRKNLLPDRPYAPKKVMFLITEGPYKGAYGIRIPELPDIADTAFTNNHCFRYAGRALVGTDSVIRVEFEPVPWLDREFDLYGTLYLRVDGYQMVGSFTRLNRLRPEGYRAGYQEYFVEARFKEIVPGIPITDSWELVNRHGTRPSVVQRSRVIGVKWLDSSTVRRDPTPR
jgi:hypothetical protein